MSTDTKLTPLGHGQVAVEPGDGTEPYVAQLGPAGGRQFEGFRRWLKQRATAHRATEERCKTSDGANERADRALECEEILKAIGDYWLGPDE